MKKFLKAIQKNFRILFRLKTSLLAMIFGPLFVIFLIGFAFNSSAQFQISIGYSSPDNSSLTEEFVDTLKQEYIVQEFSTNDECLFQLKQGLQHVCVLFPEDFAIREDKINNITFYVDKSRVNIVYAVLSSVSQQIGLKSDQLSQSLTQTLLDTLEDTSGSIDNNLGNLILVKKSLTETQESVDETTKNLNRVDFAPENVDTSVSDEVDVITKNIDDIINDVASTTADGLVSTTLIRPAISNSSAITELNELEDALESLNESATKIAGATTTAVTTLKNKITTVTVAIDTLEKKLSDADAQVAASENDLKATVEAVNDLLSDVDTIKQNLERASQRINSLEITSSSQIVNPITTSIQTVSSDKNQLLILFPYVLLLIIMFGGLMLSSTLVVVEKRSRAYFRVFTTPTGNQFYIWTTFVTGMIILITQLLIVYGVMKLFFVDLIGSNFGVTVPVLLITSALFVFIGMAIGYLMPSQQGANMFSISLGAVLLFLSNIMLPLESVAPYLQTVASYNPFVIATDVLRQGILFVTPLHELYQEIGLLGGYTLIIFILIVGIQGIVKSAFVEKLTKRTTRKIKQKSFKIYDREITTEKELVQFISQTTDKQFLSIRRNKRFQRFVREEINDALGRRARRVSKKEFLETIARKNEELLQNLKEGKPLHEKTVQKSKSKKY